MQQAGGNRYQLLVNETFEEGMVIHTRAKLGYLNRKDINDSYIVGINSDDFEQNAIKISQWSLHKRLKLPLQLRSTLYDYDDAITDNHDCKEQPGDLQLNNYNYDDSDDMHSGKV